MGRRLKSIAAVLLTLILVCLAAFAPLEYFRQQDNELLHTAHPRQQVTATIDPEAKEIYLVRAIHRIYDETASNLVSFTNVDDSMMQMYLNAQLRDVVAAGLLSETIAEDIAKTQSFSQIGITWRDGDETVKLAKYTVQIVDTFQFYYQMEGKTNKLLSIYLRDERLTGHTESQKMGLMRDFISYLGLDMVDDWVYSSEGFSSQKAQLQIYGSMGKGELALEVVPSGLYQTGTWRKRFLSNFFLIQPSQSWRWQNSDKQQESVSEQEEASLPVD